MYCPTRHLRIDIHIHIHIHIHNLLLPSSRHNRLAVTRLDAAPHTQLTSYALSPSVHVRLPRCRTRRNMPSPSPLTYVNLTKLQSDKSPFPPDIYPTKGKYTIIRIFSTYTPLLLLSLSPSLSYQYSSVLPPPGTPSSPSNGNTNTKHTHTWHAHPPPSTLPSHPRRSRPPSSP